MILYRYFRWLSLDIVLGALIFLKFLGVLYALTIPITVYLALAIAVWLIYSVDHLIDSRNLDSPDPRRAFHHKYHRQIIFFAGIVAVIGLIDVYFLPIEIIRYGAILAAFCIVYLMMVFFIPRLWFKELIVALGYSLGIFLTPMALLDSIHPIDFILFIQLAVLALVNLLVFSIYDRDRDIENGFGSLALKLGTGSVKLIWLLVIFSGSLSIYLLFFLPAKYQFIQIAYFMMSSILIVVIRNHLYFSQKERFRIVGDAIFFVPAIFLFF